MATGALLHHHLLYPRSSFPPAGPHYLLFTRSALKRLRFPPSFYTTTPSMRGRLPPILRSIQCVRQEEQGGSNYEAVEWVNKAVQDPMVEFDPVTVFRRVVAERRASEEGGNPALQTTSPPPFILGGKWPGKPVIAIVTVLVLLAMAIALYFLRSRKEREVAMEHTDLKDSFEASVNGRRKVVEDTFKAPESVLTAMELGAASVSRPKVYSGSTQERLRESNGNVMESKRPEEVAATGNAVAVEDTNLHGKPTSEQMSYSSDEAFIPYNVKTVGVDVTEGPWFGEFVNDNGILAPADGQELDSAESHELQAEKPVKLEAQDGLVENQALRLSNKTVALPVAEQFATVGEVEFEASGSTDVVDGEFHGEVVTVSEKPNSSNVQVLDFKPEETQIDGVLAESSSTANEIKQIIQEDLITSLEDAGRDDDNDDNIKHQGAEQSFILNQDDSAMALEASDSENGFEENSREDNRKALETALPAVAIGVGTVGTLLGVAGGLQVVGFTALASFLSHDFLWAQSRELLWQEVTGITDRQKLLEFLAKRNIVRRE